MEYILIGILVGLWAFMLGFIGAVIGVYFALKIVSKKLTGTVWTFDDINKIFVED